jgi:hypothetical protein
VALLAHFHLHVQEILQALEMLRSLIQVHTHGWLLLELLQFPLLLLVVVVDKPQEALEEVVV